MSPASPLPAFRTAAEVAKTLKIISAERLTELAVAGYAPCVRIDGALWFRTEQVRRWIAGNLMQIQNGMPLPVALPVVCARTKLGAIAPRAISAIADHLRVLEEQIIPPGVYFLVRGDEVVYVGQSVQIPSRISSHRQGGKVFDLVFYLTCPAAELDAIESAFIRALKPKLNGNPPKADRSRDAEILASFGIKTPEAA